MEHSTARHSTSFKHKQCLTSDKGLQESPFQHKKALHSSQSIAVAHFWQSCARNALPSWHKALGSSLRCPSARPTVSTYFLEPLHIRLLEPFGLSLTGRGASQPLPKLKGKGRIHCGLAFGAFGLPVRVCTTMLYNIDATKSSWQGGTAVSLVMLVLQRPHASSLPLPPPPPSPTATFPQPAAANLDAGTV